MRFQKFVIPWCASLLCATAPQAETFDPVALRSAVRELSVARDSLVKRLDDRIAQDAVEPPTRFVLDFPEAVELDGPKGRERRDVSLSVMVRGHRRHAAYCRIPGYNNAVHDVDPGGLALSGGKLTGKIRVTANPDGRLPADGKTRVIEWFPPDGKARVLEIEPDAVVGDKTLDGIARLSGDFGSHTGVVKGTWEKLAPMDRAAGQVTAMPGDAADVAALVRFATAAYQEARAALLCLANPWVEFTPALDSVRLAPPCWPAIGNGIGEASALDYVRELRDLAVAAAGESPAAGCILDTLAVDDPCLGPVYGDDPLPVEDGTVVLSADPATSDKGDRWQYVGRWNLLAAFPADPLRTLPVSSLPEAVFAPEATYEPDKDRLGKEYAIPKGMEAAWTSATSVVWQFGPPGQGYHPSTSLGSHGKISVGKGVHGVETGRWYAAATIRAGEDRELYAAVLADDFGKLWVNGRLVWMSRRLVQPYALIRIPFRKGENRLVLGCENEKHDSAIGLTICTRGGPRPADQRAAALRQCRDSTRALPPLTARGRNGDWTGRYPKADPPLAWDLKRKINIRWHTPLPNYSCATPVIAGDVVYVNGEPHTLYCLDKDTGAVLWERDANALEFLPENRRAEAMRAWEQSGKVNATPEMKALDAQIMEAERRLMDDETDPRLTDDERDALRKKIAAITAEMAESVKRMVNQAGRWRDQLIGFDHTSWFISYGLTFATPVADAGHVWVKYATGVAACFDRQGNRKWMAQTLLKGKPGNLSSPVLLKKTLVIQGYGQPVADKKEWERICAPWPPFFKHVMLGLDAEKGAIKWVRPVLNTGAYGGATGIVPLRLSNGTITREAVVNGDGLVFDPEDGRLLSDCRGVGASCWAGDPVVDGNRVFFGRTGGPTVVEFWVEDDGRIGSRLLFKADGGGCTPGVVVHAGRCWGNLGPPFGGGSVPWHQLSCSDAETGKRVATLSPILREGGLAYIPPAAAGDYVIVGGNGGMDPVTPTNTAQLAFVKCDPDPWVATTCRIRDEAMTAAPVFEGGRMYLRTYRSAICVEVNGKTGRDFVSQTKAAELFECIGRRPARRDVKGIAPAKDYVVPEGVAVEPFMACTAPKKWLLAGPFPADKGDAPAGVGGPSGVMPKPGAKFSCGGTDCAFEPVGDNRAVWSGGWSQGLYGRKEYDARSTVDVGGIAGRKPGMAIYLYAVMRTDQARTVTPSLTGNAETKAWFCGEPVRTNDLYALSPGHYPVLVRCAIHAAPTSSNKVQAVVSFRDVLDPGEADRQWLAGLKEKKRRLEETVRELPDSAEARTASAMLELLAR